MSSHGKLQRRCKTNELSQAQPAAAKPSNIFMLVTGGVLSGLGVIGLLVIGIVSSVCPAVLYDPPQGDVRMIVETGLSAFLKVHNLIWLFVLCCVCVGAGLLMILLNRFILASAQ